MIILDTCALIFDALSPRDLGKAAKKAIESGEKSKSLYCSDISLWEIAMLIQKKRLDLNCETDVFLQSVLDARQIQVLPINVDIAALTAKETDWLHFDPADRIIAATALYHRAILVTCDKKLQILKELNVVW